MALQVRSFKPYPPPMRRLDASEARLTQHGARTKNRLVGRKPARLVSPGGDARENAAAHIQQNEIRTNLGIIEITIVIKLKREVGVYSISPQQAHHFSVVGDKTLNTAWECAPNRKAEKARARISGLS